MKLLFIVFVLIRTYVVTRKNEINLDIITYRYTYVYLSIIKEQPYLSLTFTDFSDK